MYHTLNAVANKWRHMVAWFILVAITFILAVLLQAVAGAQLDIGPAGPADACSTPNSSTAALADGDDVRARFLINLCREPIGQPTHNLLVVQTLEAALNSSDLEQALAVFAGDAHGASSSGMRWQGRVELAAFLLQMSNPGGVSPPPGIETISRRVSGRKVVWTFFYLGSEATGTADAIIEDGHISDMFWAFTPSPIPKSDRSPIELGRVPRATFGPWPVFGSISALVIIGILLGIHASSSPSPQRHRELLSALRERRLKNHPQSDHH